MWPHTREYWAHVLGQRGQFLNSRQPEDSSGWRVTSKAQRVLPGVVGPACVRYGSARTAADPVRIAGASSATLECPRQHHLPCVKELSQVDVLLTMLPLEAPGLKSFDSARLGSKQVTGYHLRELFALTSRDGHVVVGSESLAYMMFA